jgi:ribosomal-protein-alanine N-acetyltransferase
MSATNRLSIRRATHDDLAVIVRIERASFGRDAWERQWFADYLSEPENCLFLVAEKAGTVVGYALAVYNQTRSELDSIAVAPSHRGGGISAVLMNRLTALLRRRGVVTMTLMVRLDNAAAIGLYRQLGFRRERRINGYYGDGAPAWRMRTSFGSV